jgi:hypothetical protein
MHFELLKKSIKLSDLLQLRVQHLLHVKIASFSDTNDFHPSYCSLL